MMTVHKELGNGTLRLCFSGDFVRGSDIEHLPELASATFISRLVLDFRMVDRVDAYGIGVLLRTAQRAQEAGARLEVTGVRDTVYDAIEICGLAPHLKVFRAPPQDRAEPFVA